MITKGLMKMRFEQVLREKNPERALKAANGSRKEAIYLMCISCLGTAAEARKCSDKLCFLHPYRPGAKK